MVPVLFPFLGAAVDGVLRVDSAVLAWRPLGSRKELLCASSQGRPGPRRFCGEEAAEWVCSAFKGSWDASAVCGEHPCPLAGTRCLRARPGRPAVEEAFSEEGCSQTLPAEREGLRGPFPLVADGHPRLGSGLLTPPPPRPSSSLQGPRGRHDQSDGPDTSPGEGPARADRGSHVSIGVHPPVPGEGLS